MENLRQRRAFSHEEDTKNEASQRASWASSTHNKQRTDITTIEYDSIIDRRLLDEYERVVHHSGGAITTQKKGANYHLSHPLASKDKPTDAYHRGARRCVTTHT